MVAVLLVSIWLTPSAASATSRGPAADPSPQAAPEVSTSGSTRPDPAPQASIRSRAAAPSAPSVQAPSVVRPVSTVIVHAAPPAQPIRTESSLVVSATSSRGVATKPVPAALPHPVSHPRAAAHRAAAVHRTKPDSVSFSVPFASLPKALLGLPRAALHAGAQARRDGILLLLSSLAMAALAVASFALLRRLRRLAVSVR